MQSFMKKFRENLDCSVTGLVDVLIHHIMNLKQSREQMGAVQIKSM